MQERKCPRCQYPVEATASYCPMCSTPLSNIASQTPTYRISSPQNPYAAPPPPPVYPSYYGAPQPQPIYQPPNVTPPDNKSKQRILLLSLGIALLLILAGSAALFIQSKNQEYQQTLATQTTVAKTAAAQKAATQTKVAQATATKVAQMNPYNPAMPTLQNIFFPPASTSSASWEGSSTCVASQDGTTYTVSGTPGKLGSCSYQGAAPTDYTIEVHMQLHGMTDIGGIEVRQTSAEIVMLYLEAGKASLQVFDSQANKSLLSRTAGAPIVLDSDLTIGVVADSSKISVFVNKTPILSVDDNLCNIGQSVLLSLFAVDSNPTNSGKVIYQKVKLWSA